MQDVFEIDAPRITAWSDLDLAEARRGLLAIIDQTAYVQVMSVPSGQKVVMPGTDTDKLIDEIAKLPNGKQLYICSNPLPSDMAMRLSRRTTPEVRNPAARVEDVLRRRNFLVDVDAVRPDAKQPATEAEHEACRVVAYGLMSYLDDAGWPRPLVIDSGNGWHLVYLVDLDNSHDKKPDATYDLLKSCLRSLSAICDCDRAAAVVDTGTAGAVHNLKVPGSWARKGDDTAERPHRRVRLVLNPEPRLAVPAALLEQLAALAPSTKSVPVDQQTPVGMTTDPLEMTVPGKGGSGPHPYALKVLQNHVGKLATAQPGNGNGDANGRNTQAYNSAAAIGNYVISGRLDEADVERQLLAACRACGLPESESVGAVKRGLRDGMADPRDIPSGNKPAYPTILDVARSKKTTGQYKPFPVEIFPPQVRNFIDEAAASMGCDAAYLSLPILSVLASGIGNTRVIRLKRSWTEPCILWTIIIGDSGTLKTPAYTLSLKRLVYIQTRLMKTWKADMAEWRKNKKDPPDDPPELMRFVASDVTIEKLADMLQDAPRGLLVTRDEIAAWFASFTKYKQNGSDVAAWLEMFRAGTVIVDRKTSDRKTLIVPRASISVTGGIQPRTFVRALGKDAFENGLMSRLLVAMPPRRLKQWSEADVSKETEDAFDDIVDRLLGLQMKIEPDGDVVPHTIGLSPDAKKLWVEFYGEWANRQAAAEGDVAAALSKLEGYCARFAILLHCVWAISRYEEDSYPVQDDTIRSAVELTKWFAYEAERVYSSFEESDEQVAVRRLFEFIEMRGGSISIRQLQRSNKAKYPTAKEAESAIDHLVKIGSLRWRAQEQANGRPSSRMAELVPLPESDDDAEEPE